MRLLAPAKINLHLRVGPPRADGFHPLLSWMSTVGLFDTLTLTTETPAEGSSPRRARADSGPGDGGAGTHQPPVAPVALTCDMPGLPTDERNLVVKIALAWRDEARSGEGGAGQVGRLEAALNKRIPAGAGLGGGSSDAARTLLGLNQLWGTGRATNVLSAFAARFGSDLPFFFHGPSSVCEGRGEIVRPIRRPKPGWAVLVLPDIVMPTPQVYRRFDQMNLGRDQDVTDPPDWDAWARLDSLELLSKLVNDLEPPAFDIAPALGELRATIERMLGRPVRMSGSGSSLFTLFDTDADARDAAERIARQAGQRALAVELSSIPADDLNEGRTIR